MDTAKEVPQDIQEQRRLALTWIRQMRTVRAELEHLLRARRTMPAIFARQAIVPFHPAPMNDLADISGVGPGLVWALGACGVHARAALIERDAASLCQDLGAVGTILNLRDLQMRAIASHGTLQ